MDRVEFMQGSGLLLKRSVNYYVDGKDGDDTNNGLSMDRPKATIAAAITAVNARIDWGETPWGRSDNIYIAPGLYAETLTKMPHGCNVIGLGLDVRDGQNGVKIESAKPVDVDTLINTSFYNIGFISTGAGAAFDAAILNNCHFENCFFSGAGETVNCVAALVTNDATKTTFKGCWFCNAAYGLRFEYVDGGDKVAYVLIDDCIITYISTCGIYTSTNLVGPHSVIKRTHMGGGGRVLTTGINDLSHLFEVVHSTVQAGTEIGASGAPRWVSGSYLTGLGALA